MGWGARGRAGGARRARCGCGGAGGSRRPSAVPGIESFHGDTQLEPFLARTDILVSLLPLTRATRGLLAMSLFRRLARDGALAEGPILINAGRGGLQVEADIVRALDEGVLGGASLDVFESEPLDPASRLWGFDTVIITPHSAGWSDPAELAAQIIGQIRAHEAGAAFDNVIDRAAMY